MSIANRAANRGRKVSGNKPSLRRRLAPCPFTPKAGTNGALAASPASPPLSCCTQSSGARTKIPVPCASNYAQGRLRGALFLLIFPSASAMASIIPLRAGQLAIDRRMARFARLLYSPQGHCPSSQLIRSEGSSRIPPAPQGDV